MRAKNVSSEMRLAEEIVSVLMPGALRSCAEGAEAIRYQIRGQSLRLRAIVLCHQSLTRLLRDPVREVKVEYLQRDLLRNADVTAEYRYPRPRHPHTTVMARMTGRR